MWRRKPFNGDYSDDWDLQDLDTSGGTDGVIPWQEKQQSIKEYPTSDYSDTINTARDFKEFVKTIYTESSSLLTGKSVKSTFFWNDDESDLDYFDSNSGANYVNGTSPNPLNKLAALYTSYLVTDTTDNSSDAEFTVTFADLMSDLRYLFDVFWFIEDDGTLRIEHKKYLDLKLTAIDISESKLLNESLKWDFDKSEMYGETTYSMPNASYADFYENTLTF